MTRSKTRARLTALLLAVSSIGVIAQIAEAPAAHAAVAPQLTRYPYLTDVVQTFATVNFATDRSNTTAKLKYGRVGQESCTAHSVTRVEDGIVVGTASEYQWKAKLTGLVAERAVLLPDLLRHHLDRPARRRPLAAVLVGAARRIEPVRTRSRSSATGATPTSRGTTPSRPR